MELKETFKETLKGSGTRKVLEGANLAVYTVVVVAIVVVANVAANRYLDRRWDLTPDQKYTLSPQTVKILKGLDRDINIYVFDREEAFRRERDLLDNYSATSRHLTVKYVHPDRQPSLARQFAVRNYGTVVVAAGDRHFEAQGATEEGISNALVRVLKGQKTVYFLQGHGERDLESTDRSGYSGVKKELENESSQVKTLSLLVKKEVPADASIIFVAGPQKDFLPQEVDAIRSYVNRGGRAFFMFDALADPRAENPSNLAKLLADWNVTVQNDLVIERQVRLLGAGPELTVVQKYGSNPIVQPLERTMTLFPLARSFTVSRENKAGETTDSLCETTEDSYGVADFNPRIREVAYSSKRDFKGPLTLAVSGSVTGTGEKKGEGRFVALGSSAFAANVYLGMGGNRDLFMNMVNWLSAEEDLISIRPKPPESQHLNLNQQQMNRILLVGVFGLPLLIIVTGVSVWWRRR